MILMQKFGSAYIGGDSVVPGATYDFEGPDAPPISLGSTVPGKEIQWILAGGTLIADRNLILNVGWDYLNHFDLVFGKKIVIDGRDYKVRLLRAGREGRLSDWTNLLIVVRDQDFLLNWREAKSLGIDQDKDDPRVTYSATSYRASNRSGGGGIPLVSVFFYSCLSGLTGRYRPSKP